MLCWLVCLYSSVQVGVLKCDFEVPPPPAGKLTYQHTPMSHHQRPIKLTHGRLSAGAAAELIFSNWAVNIAYLSLWWWMGDLLEKRWGKEANKTIHNAEGSSCGRLSLYAHNNMQKTSTSKQRCKHARKHTLKQRHNTNTFKRAHSYAKKQTHAHWRIHTHTRTHTHNNSPINTNKDKDNSRCSQADV